MFSAGAYGSLRHKNRLPMIQSGRSSISAPMGLPRRFEPHHTCVNSMSSSAARPYRRRMSSSMFGSTASTSTATDSATGPTHGSAALTVAVTAAMSEVRKTCEDTKATATYSYDGCREARQPSGSDSKEREERGHHSPPDPPRSPRRFRSLTTDTMCCQGLLPPRAPAPASWRRSLPAHHGGPSRQGCLPAVALTAHTQLPHPCFFPLLRDR